VSEITVKARLARIAAKHGGDGDPVVQIVLELRYCDGIGELMRRADREFDVAAGRV